MSDKPSFMTHERIMTGEEYVSYSDYLSLERERDEARDKLADWENAAAHVEADHPDEVHCGCVPVLRKHLSDARRERDEAREAFKISYNERVQMELERNEARSKYDILAVENMLEVHKLCKERDEWAAMCGRYKQERDEAIDIIRKAKAKFCEDGADGKIASEMFSILIGNI